MTEPSAELRVCRYLRKSRDDGNGETLEETFARHTRMTDAMAADRGFEIQYTYPEVVSGASISERPQMRQLLQDLKARRWDVVIVVDISRLSRGDGSDQTVIANAFKLTGTKCLSEYKLYDLSDADDLELFERKLQNSRSEYKSITKRLNRGVLESVREGYVAGGIAPYGLVCVGPTRKKVYEVDEALFPNYLSAMEYCHDALKPTLSGLRRHMHSLGIPSPTGREWWSKPALEYMVFNDAYIGISIWGVHKTEPYLGENFEELKRKVVTDDYIRVPAKWPPFIDPDYVIEARRKLLPQPHIANSTTLANPLAGLLRCAKCGYTMLQRPARNRTGTYYVHADHDRAVGCSCKSAPRDDVMCKLLEALQTTLKASELSLTDAGAERERERMAADLERLSKAIEKSRKTLVDAYYRLDAGKIDEDVYASVSEIEKGRISRLEATAAELATRLEEGTREVLEERVEHLNLMIGALQDEALTPAQVNDVLKAFVDRIDYTNRAEPRTRRHDIVLEVFLR